MGVRRDSYLLGRGEGEALWGLDGALSIVKVTAEASDGRMVMIEETAARSEGIPLHLHAGDDETFYVLDGELQFVLGDRPAAPAAAGSVVHIPGGVAHSFRVRSETATYLILTTPRHAAFYRAISRPAASRTLPPAAPLDMGTVEAACMRYGVEILGPPPAFDD